ncbi:MAG TPA: hypothetical protein VGV39_05940 [Mesorhizobium sp.]|uniref:hypothetical protein n=1 Tax=Mesorhizobium sp. TaxID=1871066 RepID=UPI002DDD619D|nr:hypothetical protein [Mesorhizobium sp.]HEV2502594.1 hypothetical protein [Mesorhizobium sp.]
MKAIRDQAKTDAERTQVALEGGNSQAITQDMLESFTQAAREGLRFEGGGYRRDYLRALAQHIEVADTEIRIKGSKSELLRALVAAPTQNRREFEVHSSVLKWRTRQDSNL